MTTKQYILEKATEAVADRGLNYGSPEDNFNRIAHMWNVHLYNTQGPGSPVLGPHDVAMMMILVKVSRLQNAPTHQDSWIDIAGYAACGGSLGAKAKT